MARLGYVQDAIDAAAAVPFTADRWIVLADVASALALAGQTADAQKVAAAIAHPEERGKAMAEIALQLASRDQVDAARQVAGRITNESWHAWTEERLALLQDGKPVALATGPKKETAAPRAAEELDFDRILEIAADLLAQRPHCLELHELAAAAAAENGSETLATAGRFWRARVDGDKTYLETVAEQPRTKFLKTLQKMAPVLTPVLTATEAEQLAGAIRDVCTWWP